MTKRNLQIAVAIISVITFAVAAFVYKNSVEERMIDAPAVQEDFLVRAYSPTFGPPTAPVTIVEFFDPACEACRAFHPIVKSIRDKYPNSVRVVLRYTIFHKGSEEAVRILETARLQGIFEPVLEALLAAQPKWAAHGRPDLSIAWEAAAGAGLDVDRARREMLMPDIMAILNQDMEDVKRAGVKQTPTFFVNGKPLPSFGSDELYKLVKNEVEAAGGKSSK